MFMLTALDLYNPDVDFFIENIILERNNVAHGNKIYHDKAIFPVTPFHQIIKSPNYPLSILRYLSARLISKYLETDMYECLWIEYSEYLLPSHDSCVEFIANGKFKRPDPKSSDSKFYFGGVNNLVLKKPKKISLVIPFYKRMLTYKTLNKDFYPSNIDAIVMIIEHTKDSEIEELCIKSLDKITELDCNPYFKYRDMVYHLQYEGINLIKLINHLKSGRLK